MSALALVSSFAYGNALRKRYAGIPKLSFNTESLITREQELLSCWRMCEFGALYLDHIVSFLLQLGRIHAVWRLSLAANIDWGRMGRRQIAVRIYEYDLHTDRSFSWHLLKLLSTGGFSFFSAFLMFGRVNVTEFAQFQWKTKTVKEYKLREAERRSLLQCTSFTQGTRTSHWHLLRPRQTEQTRIFGTLQQSLLYIDRPRVITWYTRKQRWVLSEVTRALITTQKTCRGARSNRQHTSKDA